MARRASVVLQWRGYKGLQIIIFFGEGNNLGLTKRQQKFARQQFEKAHLLQLLLVLSHQYGVDLNLSGLEGRSSNELESGVAV